MNERFPSNFGLPFVMAVICAFGIIIGMRLQESLVTDNYLSQDQAPPYFAIYEATEHIRNKFYGDLNEEEYVNSVLDEMIGLLDPFSHYFEQTRNANYNRFMNGLYRGVGLEFVQKGDSAYVYQVIDDSPAARSEIRRGDIVTALDSFSLVEDGWNLDSLMRYSKKEIGETVHLETYRVSTRQKHAHNLVIEEVTLPLIEDYILQDDSGGGKTSYIHIKRFYADVFRDFMRTLEVHADKNGPVQRLIIDLRDNPGGVVEETVKILNQLITEKERLLLTTRSRVAPDKEYRSNGRSFLTIERITVICNKHSASASEILAGVLQDYDQAVIIGQNTYGKGLIQQNYDLANHGSINLSIGEYILPSGRHIYKQAPADSIFYSLGNNRPLPSPKGIPVDFTIDDCPMSTKLENRIKDYVVKYGLWDQAAILDVDGPLASLVEEVEDETPCALSNESLAAWSIIKNSVACGSIVAAKDVDASIKKAFDIMQTEEYNTFLGNSD